MGWSVSFSLACAMGAHAMVNAVIAVASLEVQECLEVFIGLLM